MTRPTSDEARKAKTKKIARIAGCVRIVILVRSSFGVLTTLA